MVSQSGETIDALLALRALKSAGVKVIAISNVMDSAIPRESHLAIYTRTGPEIGGGGHKDLHSSIDGINYIGHERCGGEGLRK